jgi:hypothetical protein
MPKLGFVRVFFVFLLALISAQGVHAQSDQPIFSAPQWRVVAQYYDAAERRLYYLGLTPVNLPNYSSAQAACQAGAAYVLPRLSFSSWSVEAQPTMAFAEVRPFGKVDYFGPESPFPITSFKGHKCAINGYRSSSNTQSIYDIFENGTRITTIERHEIASETGTYVYYQQDKFWAGSIAVAPVCPPLYSLITKDGGATCAALERPIKRNAPDCEGSDGDSPKSAAPKNVSVIR